MEIRRYLLALRRWWWLVLLGMIITGGAGYIFSSQQAPIYASTVRVIVGQTLQRVNPDYGSLAASERLASTYAELAQSRLLAQKTAEALERTDLNNAAILVQAVPETEFLDITVQTSEPQLAADIANELANQLILQSPAGPQSPDSKILAEVEAQIAALNQDISQTEQEINRIQDQLQTLDSDDAEFDSLQDQLQLQQELQSSNRQTLSTLYSTVLGNRTNSLSIVEPAILNPTRIAPQPVRTAILLCIVGLLLSVGFIFAIEYLDDTITTPEEVVHIVNAPLLAAIIKQPRPEKAHDRLVSKLDPRSPAAESFRTLRTNLQFSNIDSKTRSLVVTSGQPEEGKSTVASNLAWTLAQSGQRVILIDADLRKPMLHRIFQLANDAGLTTLLSNADDPTIADQAMIEIFPGLTVVPSGPQPPNPSELLSSKRMEMLVWLFQQDYDWVIFDTPPVLTVTDPLALAPRVDGVLLVAEGKRTRRGILEKSRIALETVGAKIIGTAVNKLDPRAEGYYAYYTYYYDHRHNESDQQRRWKFPWSKNGASNDKNGHTPAPSLSTPAQEPAAAADDLVDQPSEQLDA